MFTSLRFLCFGNTPLPSLSSPSRAQSIESSSSFLSPIEEETTPQTTPKSDDRELTLSSSIGPYPIPSSLMREVESIRSHILQQKSRHQKQHTRRHKRARRQKLQPIEPPTIVPSVHCQVKLTPTSYNDVSNPYAEDTSVFELTLAEREDRGGLTVSTQEDVEEITVNTECTYPALEEQSWNEIESSAYLGLDDFISQGYLEGYDNSIVYDLPQKPGADEIYTVSEEIGLEKAPIYPAGDTGWWLIKHIDPKALSRFGSDCVIL
ncbi:hypothetical protein TWF730_005440 [Orbilia blumenaviensis]|uniref:Uncharacterized protein n=1 Tax=Orbilia blumenaviensis TaxID=1796055 RepID=A0AAV9VL92_9PEZI